MVRHRSPAVLAVIAQLGLLSPGVVCPTATAAQRPGTMAAPRPASTIPHELWQPPPDMQTAGTPATPIEHCGPWVRDGFVSVQVNVDQNGCNIVGDAANEPSIAVDPTDPRKIAIGWRQFNTVRSDFRQAGFGYSRDAGHTWTFGGVLDPGVFGSDPVLASGPDGTFYYTTINFEQSRVFRSYDGGRTWPASTVLVATLADKPWMTVDQTSGIGRGHIYIVSEFVGLLWRSNDGGISFEAVSRHYPPWTTLSVGPDGTLYILGDHDGEGFFRSDNIKDFSTEPTFQSPLGPDLSYFLHKDICGNPNPGGLWGQPWIATDHSNGPTRGNLYALFFNAFSRSTDGGDTWSEAIRVTEDYPECGSFLWFAMMSVAPSGRIDAVWNDTRNSGQANLSELFYSHSSDAGETWARSVPVSPMFDSHVGWPQQNKLGDYYHMVSDDLGVNVAYAATFNGEQDVYFLRIGPFDCNGNRVPDEEDLASRHGIDCNHNAVPDECEEDCNGNGMHDSCETDLDGDGVIDACDNCVSTPNPGQADCDGNGDGDLCELAECLAKSKCTDCDLDGVPDWCQGDADADGTLEPCDNCPGLANVDQADSDKDGVGDLCDNCAQVKNPLQEDCNENQIGDACEIAACDGSPECSDCNPNGTLDSCELAPRMNALLPPDVGPYEDYTYDLDMSGNMLLVSAPEHPYCLSFSYCDYPYGAAFVYEYASEGWLLAGKLYVDAAPTDSFGYRVAISDRTAGIVESRHKAIFLFTRHDDGWSLAQQLQLDLEDDDRIAGFDLEGDLLAVSIQPSRVPAIGHLMIYEFDGLEWRLSSTREVDTPYNLQISEGIIALGVPGGIDIFRRTGGDWAQTQRIPSTDGFTAFDGGVLLLPEWEGSGWPGDLAGRTFVYRCGEQCTHEDTIPTVGYFAADRKTIAILRSPPEMVSIYRFGGSKWSLTNTISTDGPFLDEYSPLRHVEVEGEALAVSSGDARPEGSEPGAWTGVVYATSLPPPDCNANSVPDECETTGDFDGDSRTTLRDFAALQNCMTPAGETNGDICCRLLDLDGDQAVSTPDLTLFLPELAGPEY